jgi:hypothetical protein
MADYARIRVSVVHSPNSDYSDPDVNVVHETTLSPTEWAHIQTQVLTGGTTVELGSFTTVSYIVVHNADGTNFVSAAWTANAVANVQRIGPGQTLLIPKEATVANDLVLTADTAACDCEIYIAGA